MNDNVNFFDLYQLRFLIQSSVSFSDQIVQLSVLRFFILISKAWNSRSKTFHQKSITKKLNGFSIFKKVHRPDLCCLSLFTICYFV